MKYDRRSTAQMRVASVVLLVLVTVCGPITESASERRNVTITFTRAASNTPSMFPSPYVSVVDTVILTVTEGDTGPSITRRTRLARRDSIASFTLPLASGQWAFEAVVVSNNGTPIFSGNTTVDVAGTDVSVDLVVSPIAPILLAAPDSTTVTIDATGLAYALDTLYNVGPGDLVWSIPDTVPAESRTQCGNVGCVRLTPKRGALVRGQPVTIAFISNQSSAFKSPIMFVVTTPTGNVPVVIRPSPP